MKKILHIFYSLRFWSVIAVLSIAFSILSLLVRCFDSTGDASHTVNSWWSRGVCFLNGVKVEIVGLEHVLTDQPQIFVSNHQSFFDIFTLDGYLPVQLRWISKASIFRIPFVGWAMYAANYIGVERGDSKQAYQSFMATIDRLKQGKSVVIFPEGTRSVDGTIGPFKKGSQLLAVRSNAPMVPVTVIGTKDIMPKGSMTLRPGTVRIIISEPIQPDKSMAKDPTILETLRNIICQSYKGESHTKPGQ